MQDVQPFLQHQTVTFVCQLVNVTGDQCSEILQQLDLLDSYAAEEEEESPLVLLAPSEGLLSPLPGSRRSWGWWWQIPPLLARAGMAPLVALAPPKRRACWSQASSAHKRPCVCQH